MSPRPLAPGQREVGGFNDFFGLGCGSWDRNEPATDLFWSSQVGKENGAKIIEKGIEKAIKKKGTSMAKMLLNILRPPDTTVPGPQVGFPLIAR